MKKIVVLNQIISVVKMRCAKLRWNAFRSIWTNVTLSSLKRQSRLQQTIFINIFHCFSEKIRLDVSSKSSARQRIRMKYQTFLFSKDKSKKLKCRLLQFLFGAVRVERQPEVVSFFLHSHWLACIFQSSRKLPSLILLTRLRIINIL